MLRLFKRFSLKKMTACLPAAIVISALSAVSLCFFFYIRSQADLLRYYQDASASLFSEAIGGGPLWVFLPVLALCLLILPEAKPRVGSIAVAAVLSLNMVFSLAMENSGLTEIFLPGGVLVNILALSGFGALLFTVIEGVFLLFDKKTEYRIELVDLDAEAYLKQWGIAALCVLLLWAPTTILAYPGSVTGAMKNQLMSWLGMRRMDNSGPPLLTALYGSLYQLGKSMGSENKAIFLPIAFQALFNAAALGGMALFVYRYTRHRAWYVVTILFFGVLPMWQNAAQFMRGDVIYIGCYVLFYLQYLKCLREQNKRTSDVIVLGLCALLISFTRKGGFYLAAFSLLALIVYNWKEYVLPYAICLVLVAGACFAAENALYPALNIRAAGNTENYSLPIQQVALYCQTHQEEMTEADIAAVNETLDFNKIIANYTPSDASAVTGTFHGQGKFWSLYFKLFWRDPLLFVKSAVMTTFEHMNPWYTGSGVQLRVYIATGDDFFHTTYKFPAAQKGQLWSYWNGLTKQPVIGMFTGSGLYTWALLIVLAYAAKRRSREAVLGLLPQIFVFLGLFLAPENGGVQYGYPLCAATPLILAWVLYASSQSSPLREGEDAHAHLLQDNLDNVKRKTLWLVAWLRKLRGAGKKKTRKNIKAGAALGFVQQYIPTPQNPKTHLSFLKIIAIYMVLWNQTFYGFDLYNRVLDMPWHLVYLCVSIFVKSAVPLFFMISGALLLGKEETYGHLFKHRVLRFAEVLLFVSVLSYLVYYNNDPNASLSDFFTRLYSGAVLTPLWYLYSYISFLLMLPFIRKMAKLMKDRDYYWLGAAFLISNLIPVADYFVFKGAYAHSSYFFFFTSYTYVVYSLAGYYIEKVMKDEHLSLEGLLLLTMLSVLSIFATYLMTEAKMKNVDVWSSSVSQTYFNTLILIPSVTVFYGAKLWFKRFPVSNRTAVVYSIISTCTFGTYLYERFWREQTRFIYNWLSKKMDSFSSSLIQIVAACVLGILGTMVWKVIWGMVKQSAQRLMASKDAEKEAERKKGAAAPIKEEKKGSEEKGPETREPKAEVAVQTETPAYEPVMRTDAPVPVWTAQAESPTSAPVWTVETEASAPEETGQAESPASAPVWTIEAEAPASAWTAQGESPAPASVWTVEAEAPAPEGTGQTEIPAPDEAERVQPAEGTGGA